MNATESPFRAWTKKLPRAPLVDRDGYILSRCAGRRVLHLGACDAPSTVEKAVRGELLHQKLQGRCASLIGYDIDAESAALLRDRFGLNDIVVRDLASPEATDGTKGDLVVCADIIEHVDNAGSLLVSCNRMLPVGGDLLVSTIHALSLKHALRAFLAAREIVHPDHVSYYTYATLGVLLGRFGFEPTAFRYFAYPTGRVLGHVFDLLYRLAPHAANGILVEAKKVRDV